MPVEIKEPEAPATSRQTWLIKVLGGGDVRNDGLTRQQASDRIVALQAAKDGAKAPEAAKAGSETPRISFAKIVKLATKAANEAGDSWCASHTQPVHVIIEEIGPNRGKPVATMLDLCGFSWIVMTDKRTAFAKWVKNVFYKDAPLMQNSNFLHLPHKYRDRQEIGLREACSLAAIDVLVQHGIKHIRHESRID
jgi:hypothetical protein